MTLSKIDTMGPGMTGPDTTGPDTTDAIRRG